VMLDNLTQTAFARDLSSFTDPATESWIGVPLTAWGVVLGMLCVGRHQANSFTPRDLEAVVAFSKHAALTVETMGIRAELQTSLSNLKAARAHLNRAARLAAAGEIALGVAHQINNPLTTVIAESGLLLSEMKPDSPGYDSAIAIEQAAYRAGSVVQRMLDFARTVPYQMTAQDINRSVHNSIALVRAQIEPRARITVHLALSLPPIQASEVHLEDVWVNLLLNARDALENHDDGEIDVRTELDEKSNMVMVTIADNGKGIPQDQQPRIFDPFFTTKERGTGLGLSICHEVIVRHGGRLEVRSQIEQGTTFIIHLPLD
jgi:signal transduction histidine kinase